MRWLTGWSGLTAADPTLAAVRPIAGTLLWGGPNPLWAVGDWRPDELRLAVLRPGGPATVRGGLDPGDPTDQADRDTPATLRLAVAGRCGATDRELADGLAAARGGALRHLTHWPGSYAVVLRAGTRSTVLLTDLAGAQPAFHTPFAGGTAYATAALPLADLVGAPVDAAHLAARLATPDTPETLGDHTPYRGVRRVPPGHALGIRGGRADSTSYLDDPVEERAEAPAVRELTRALLEAVRCRVRATAPADRPRLGVDLSYGTASATVALLAAAVPLPAGPGAGAEPDRPAARTGAVKGSWARRADQPEPETLPAVTLGDAAGLALAVHAPRLRHLVLEPVAPYAQLAEPPPAPRGAGWYPHSGPLTDEPGPALIDAARYIAAHRAGGADHLTGHGARQVLDGHPARLADLVRAGRPLDLLAPIAALAGADRATAGALTGTLHTPVTVLRAARRLARGRYADALDDLALRLTLRHTPAERATMGRALAADLAWHRPGPAAHLLADEPLAALAQHLRTAARRPAPTEAPGARRARLALHRHAAHYRTLVHATEQHGQRLHAPFLDNQVVRAARLLPDDLRLQPGARHALLAAVLAGAGRTDLPADWGRGTGADPHDSARRGLRAAAPALTDLLDRPLLGEAGLLDVPAARKTLAAATDPAQSAPPGTLAALADLIATELWLRRLAARRPGSSWAGLPAPHRTALPT
ncbi:asparagine synthase-related protein [Streptomyces sp. TLI_171]|uniref:asparagine synthase-related protein n=1 Tax=Streptomyces sp. TLI_171 TaxID=1938859 RepID=UPI000C41B528|nr:asparagine synthase-related protein [Streptomyces sp. TLI_171]RKE20548.1 asparagine synthase [Streptomyces sp. TLI_171]